MRDHTLNPATNAPSASEFAATIRALFDKLDDMEMYQDALLTVMEPELDTPAQEALAFAIRSVSARAQEAHVCLVDCVNILIERLRVLEVAHV